MFFFSRPNCVTSRVASSGDGGLKLSGNLDFFFAGRCPAGTTYDGISNYCRVCRHGLYSVNQECVFCPDGTMTITEGARSAAECVLPVLPGHSYPFFNKGI